MMYRMKTPSYVISPHEPILQHSPAIVAQPGEFGYLGLGWRFGRLRGGMIGLKILYCMILYFYYCAPPSNYSLI